MLPGVLRLSGKHHFDERTGTRVSKGTVEIRADIRGEGFECGGILRHLGRGCGKGCPCITCEAEPRRDGKPPAETPDTCRCIRCRRRRQRGAQ